MPDQPVGNLNPNEVAGASFATVRRGYDPVQVRAFLTKLADSIRHLQDRLAEAERIKVSEQLSPRAPQPAGLDESSLVLALGQEAARVLQSAHEAAREVRERAEKAAAETLAEAKRAAEALRGEAERVLAQRTEEAESQAQEIRRQAHHEVEALVAKAKEEASFLLHQAQEMRTGVLADLAGRRKAIQAQLETLRSYRDRLVESIKTAKGVLEGLEADLNRADKEHAALPPMRSAPAAPSSSESAEHFQAEQPREPGAARMDVVTQAAASRGPLGDRPGGAGIPEAEEGVRILGAARAEPVGATARNSESGETEESDGQAPTPREARREGGDPSPRVAVEEIFARIREGREKEAAKARRILRTGEAADSSAQAEASSGHGVANDSIHVGESQDSDGAQMPEANPQESGALVHKGLAARRDELLAGCVATLVRRLKRELQDEQNLLLDQLRSASGQDRRAWLAAGSRPKRYERAAQSALEEAWRAGFWFVGSEQQPNPKDASVAVAPVAAALAGELAAALNRRLADAEGEPSDQAGLVSAAYREWRAERLERLAVDHAIAAFSRGSLSAMGPKGKARWVVLDEGGPCPDCDDNALAGVVQAGELFPTGQAHPPAHAGCRCLLEPAMI